MTNSVEYKKFKCLKCGKKYFVEVNPKKCKCQGHIVTEREYYIYFS